MQSIRRLMLLVILSFVAVISFGGTAHAEDVYRSFLWHSADSGINWSESTAGDNTEAGAWVSLASSADGTKIIAGQFNPYSLTSRVWRSTDSGATWTKIPGLAEGIWFGLASSADGTKLAAADGYGGGLYLSNDSGSTWTLQEGAGNGSWASLAMSADGTKIFAGQGTVYNSEANGTTYLSTDSGATWTSQEQLGTGQWWSASMSDDGSFIAVTNTRNGGDLVYSTDYGESWDALEDCGAYATSISGDGSTILVSQGLGTHSVIMSTDHGQTWVNLQETTNLPVDPQGYTLPSLSYDGAIMIIPSGSGIMRSTDHGQTWSLIESLIDVTADSNDSFWYPSTMSADGSKQYVGRYDLNQADEPGDQDNISPEIESNAPNDGDANNDLTADAEQDNVASFINPVTDSYASLAVDDSCAITDVGIEAEAANAVQDNDHSYPLGMMNFSLDCGEEGYEATIDQYYYGSDLNINDLSVRKYNPNTNQYQDIDDATVSTTTIGGQRVIVVSYTVKDGGPLDTDGEEDSSITDPAGLALSSGSGTVTGSDQSDTVNSALAETGQSINRIYILVALILSVAGLGLVVYRKRKKL